MKMMKNMALGGLAAVLVAMSAFAQANLVTNGSFEEGAINIGDYTTLYDGDSISITGWEVLPVSIDYIGSYWEAGDGGVSGRSVDLNGRNVGGLTQTFATADGQAYNVSFLLSGNPDSGPTVKTLDVLTNGNSHLFDFNITGNSRTNMGWKQKTFTFIATGDTSTINFMSTTGGASTSGECCWGPALDGVSVTAVPEPETYAMMLAGLGLMGFIARRRKQNDAAA
jgi:choice-of-anchor C domain-containing protein